MSELVKTALKYSLSVGFNRLFERYFGHVEVQILELVNAKRDTEMPAIFAPPHFHVREIAFLRGNQPEGVFFVLDTPVYLFTGKSEAHQLSFIQGDRVHVVQGIPEFLHTIVDESAVVFVADPHHCALPFYPFIVYCDNIALFKVSEFEHGNSFYFLNLRKIKKNASLHFEILESRNFEIFLG
jgi:hypothetical protein